MAHNIFGGAHTEKKLQIIANYLNAYTHVLKNTEFQTVFFDAFAGSGGIQSQNKGESLFEVNESDLFMEGSATRALHLRVPFHRYVFVERARRKISELEQLRGAHPALADRIDIQCRDANEALHEFCNGTNWSRTRAVVFLDPFGNQVDWTTVAKLAATRAVDLWYLFPSGLGVVRQISLSGKVLEQHAASLDRLLGTTEWRHHFLRPATTRDLFSHEVSGFERQVTADSVTDFLVKRLDKIFRGGALDQWLPLGSRGVHMYSLVFACANPSKAANEKALRIARSVMQIGGKGGRRK